MHSQSFDQFEEVKVGTISDKLGLWKNFQSGENLFFSIKSVAMCQIKPFPFQFDNFRFSMYDKPDFLFQVTKSPNVVITGEKVNFNATVDQFSHFPEKRTYPFGTTVLYSNQKIEHVAEHVYMASNPGFLCYPTNELKRISCSRGFSTKRETKWASK